MAQETKSVGDSVSAHEQMFEGVKIDSIAVVTHDVFNTENPKFRSFPYRVANALHLQTKSSVVKSELLLHVGDVYSTDLARETERNIRARLVVYTVTVRPQRLADGRLLVVVETVDQWSLAGGVGLRKEGDAVDYDVTVSDRNLFGFNHQFGFSYVHPADLSEYLIFSYAASRIGSLPLAFNFGGSSNSEAKGVSGTIGKPYYDRLQRFSFFAGGASANGTVSVRRDRTKIGEAELSGSQASAGVFYRTGSLQEKLTFGGFYTYRYEDVRDTTILGETPEELLSAQNSLPVDSNYHELGFGAEIRKIDYLQCKRIDRYNVIEDYTLGPVMYGVVNKPFIIEGDDHYRFDFGVGFTGYLASTLIMLNHQEGYWLEHSQVLRRTKSLTVKVFNNHIPWLTPAFNGYYVATELSSDADLLNLGGFSGLRGYPQYFRSGNRVGVLSSELRFYSGINILSVAIGSALFADVGSSWKATEPLSNQGVYASVGGGLRLFADRVSGGAAVRIDLVYSEKYGTQLSISTGQNIAAKSGEIGLTNH